jgi:hypothetical protein
MHPRREVMNAWNQAVAIDMGADETSNRYSLRDDVGCGPRSADQACASGFFPLSKPLGFFLPVALLFVCSLFVLTCALLIAPCYGCRLVTCTVTAWNQAVTILSHLMQP